MFIIAAAAVVAACLLAPGTVAADSVAAASRSVTFTAPAAGSLSYGTVNGWRVSWRATGAFATQRLTEAVAPPDADGGCTAVNYRDGTAHTRARSPLTMAGPAGRCYRYRLDLLSRNGRVLGTATSGGLRSLGSWTSHEELYRTGAFSTQSTLTWCVGASIQIMLNEIRRQSDHRRSSQKAYMVYARHHDRHLGLKAPGSDPLGWAAALNRFNGGIGYQVHVDGTLESAIHAAAQRLRLTGHPVGLLVLHGDHAWVMSGFQATADPALTNDFTVTAVYVEGPLFPRQNAAGYDKAPDTRLTLSQLRPFFRRYSARHATSPWDRKFVTVQP